MTLSLSNLSIRWTPPDPSEEQWEFSSHPAKQDFYQRNRVTWEWILAASEHGRMVPYPRGDTIEGISVALNYHRYEDFARYLAKARRGYRLPYARMETALQQAGHLSLPAPIILLCGNEALLFSGYRRLCLAWNHGMVPMVWLITLPFSPSP